MDAHPLQSFRPSDTGRGTGPLKADDAATTLMMVEVKKEGKRPANDELPAPLSPSINLGLEIGTNSVENQNSSTTMVHRQTESVLTISQLHELQQQVLIHKHLAAGLRVPTHLLIPIWKSVARTLGSNDGIYERYSSFSGFTHPGFNHGSMMDPEPGRCRRTDGKKWRCSRNTVLHQKYCERHMHRGRQCSRKPVEASEIDPPSKTILLNNSDRVGSLVAAPATSTSRNNKTKNHFSCSFPTAITFPLISESIIPSARTITKTITSCTHATIAIHTSCADATTTMTMVPASATNTTATHVTAVPSINPTTTASIKTSCIIDLKDVCNLNYGENCTKNQNDFSPDIKVQKIPSPALGFSPNSVLQGCSGSGSCYDSKINIGFEPGRCRRTDGKKWRCRRDAIPNQKYCELHMHRGSKRHFKASQKVAFLSTSAATSGITLLPSAMTLHAKAEPATLNTNLSMSIRASDKQKHSDERSNVSSSSETTITDTTITAYENISS